MNKSNQMPRWFQFSLRLLLLALVAANVFWWTHTQFLAERAARQRVEAKARQWDDFLAWAENIDQHLAVKWRRAVNQARKERIAIEQFTGTQTSGQFPARLPGGKSLREWEKERVGTHFWQGSVCPDGATWANPEPIRKLAASHRQFIWWRTCMIDGKLPAPVIFRGSREEPDILEGLILEREKEIEHIKARLAELRMQNP